MCNVQVDCPQHLLENVQLGLADSPASSSASVASQVTLTTTEIEAVSQVTQTTVKRTI